MITTRDFINNLVKFNAKHIAELKSEEEVKDWLISLLWSVVGFKQSISEEELDRLAKESNGFEYGGYMWDGYNFGFKAGYKKAKEE